VYSTTPHDRIDYNLAYVGSDFTMTLPEPLDPGYMRALFDYGYRRARRGCDWSKSRRLHRQCSGVSWGHGPTRGGDVRHEGMVRAGNGTAFSIRRNPLRYRAFPLVAAALRVCIMTMLFWGRHG
jgi:hypothetical protein